FTEGLVLYGNMLYESCASFGNSTVREVDPKTGEIRRTILVPDEQFGEGITAHNGSLFVLTWTGRHMYIFDTDSLEHVATKLFRTSNGEGWGLTTDGTHLIASDGSPQLTYFAMPDAQRELVVVKTLPVLGLEPLGPPHVDITGRPIGSLNELEYADGFVYANVWMRDVIVKIDPGGKVQGKFDLSLLSHHSRKHPDFDPGEDWLDAVSNGIAFNASAGTFILTGKLWPNYYFVAL
ncbi:glutamine cyclotransferase, partial [Ochromonadaceae sp. CCMP2298]